METNPILNAHGEPITPLVIGDFLEHDYEAIENALKLDHESSVDFYSKQELSSEHLNQRATNGINKNFR